MTPGERIRKLREEQGVLQSELASMIGTSKQNIWKYENGVITNIPLDKIEAMAQAFQVNPSYITGWSDEADPEAAYAARQQEMEAALHEMGFTISDTNPQLDQIMTNAQKLNADGQQQLADYSDLLVASGKYEKTPLDFEEVQQLREEYRKESQKEE